MSGAAQSAKGFAGTLAQRVAKYLRHGQHRIEGWVLPLAAEVIVELAALQRSLGIRGPVGEIGVHHGRLFILLHLLTEPPEISVAWDLFERQHENVDRSGSGDRAVLERNLELNGCDLDRIRVRTENSLNLTPERILADCGGQPRLLSIDGGHTSEVAYNDLSLAATTLCEGGIIILDDFFQEAWPGVAEGVCRFFHAADTNLVPIAILGNKVFLTNDETLAAKYREGIGQHRPAYERKKSAMFGHPVLVVTRGKPTVRNFVAGTRIGRWISRHVLPRWL